MTPYEVMLSESQERMLVIAKREHIEDVRALFHRWELHCEEIGHVIEGRDVVITSGGQEVGRVPATIATDPPLYRRQGVRSEEVTELNRFDFNTLPDLLASDATSTLLKLLARPNIASKRGVYRQYDQQVLNNTVVQPGGDAAVLRVPGTNKGIALKTDCNGRYVYLDPYNGGAIAVAEAARNVVCTGATPVAITDCLNFGNPEKAGVYYQLEQAIRGISEACSEFETPVVSGNVSLYNETAGRPVYPTPVVGMLGLMEDVNRHLRAGFSQAGAQAWLLGAGLDQAGATLSGSEYLEAIHGKVAGLPTVDLSAERRLQQLVLRLNDEGVLLSAHDCSDGGLAITLAECSIIGGHGFRGVEGLPGRLDAALFGEGQGRIIVSSKAANVGRLQALAAEMGVPSTLLGEVTSTPAFTLGPVATTVPTMREAWESLLRS